MNRPSFLTGRRLRWALPAVGLAVLGAVLFFLLAGPDSATTTTDAPAQIGLPARLQIPSVQVDAPVEAVGLTPDGAMDVPTIALHAGWYDRGPRPGAPGSAVIDGHFDSADGGPAVFGTLNQLKVGESVSVRDAAGTTVTFLVRATKQYNPDQDAADVFGSSDGQAHLNLITCAGTWNTAQQTYSSRLVVFTDRVTDQP